MSLLRLRAELLAQRYGWLPMLSLVLAVAAAWFALVATPGLERQAAELRFAEASLAAQARAVAAAGEAEPPLVHKRYAAFRDQLVAQGAIPDVIRTLFSEARKAGLVLDHMDYRLKRGKDEGYLTYGIEVPIKGPYSRICRFAAGVLMRIPAAALEDISFRRDAAGTSDTEAEMRFVVYLKDGD